MKTSPEARAACVRNGTKQCAAICLRHSVHIPLGECPEAERVYRQNHLRTYTVRWLGYTGTYAAANGSRAKYRMYRDLCEAGVVWDFTTFVRRNPSAHLSRG